jgi:hypothetical protein
MKLVRPLLSILLSSMTLSACVDEASDETLGEVTSDLSVTSWTTFDDGLSDDVGYPPTTAVLGGKDYFVYTYDQGSNPFPGVPHDLYWHRCDGTSCTGMKRIPGQQTNASVSLAAFNGYLYMVHTGESDSSALWFSRFDPATEQWSTNVKLTQTTLDGAPALAAFNNQLYMVGTQELTVSRRGMEVTTYPMWYVTMNTAEVFSATRSVGRESASRPSLASFFGKLYLAHQYGATGGIAINTLAPGSTSWSQDQLIKSGTVPLYGYDVQIAEANGFLHLVHSSFTNNYTYWMYFDGCNWAPELTIDARQTTSRLTMSTSRVGLELARLHDYGLWPYTHNAWISSSFLAPPAPITVPLCLPTAG